MRCRSLVLVLIAGLGGIAAAQPGPPPAPPPPPADTTTTTTTTDPAPPDPTPQPQPQPQPHAMPAVEEAPARTDRPEGFSIGLGLGYGLPTSLETPNRTSARIRLASGLTFEPLFSIANTKTTHEMAPAPDTETKVTEFGVATLVRLPVITHNHVDLEALASAGFSNTKTNPDGDFNSKTVNTFAIGWGVGIGYWLSRHWQLSMSVTNPLIQYSKTTQQRADPITMMRLEDIKDSETTLGIIFAPQVTAMIHLYN